MSAKEIKKELQELDDDYANILYKLLTLEAEYDTLATCFDEVFKENEKLKDQLKQYVTK